MCVCHTLQGKREVPYFMTGCNSDKWYCQSQEQTKNLIGLPFQSRVGITLVLLRPCIPHPFPNTFFSCCDKHKHGVIHNVLFLPSLLSFPSSRAAYLSKPTNFARLYCSCCGLTQGLSIDASSYKWVEAVHVSMHGVAIWDGRYLSGLVYSWLLYEGEWIEWSAGFFIYSRKNCGDG